MIRTESEAYDSFVERGFDGSQVMYEYTMDGTYLGENEEFLGLRHQSIQCIKLIMLPHQEIYG